MNSVPDAQKQPFHYELTGMIASQTGKPQEAENAYKKALEKEPNRTRAERLLYDQYVQTGKFDEAIKILDDQIKKNPSDRGPYTLKGTLYERQGKTEEAKQSYTLALQGDPNQDIAANNLAVLLSEQGTDLTTALGYAQGVRKRHPEDPNLADTLAWVYYKMGRAILAKEPAQFAASKQPGNPLFQYHLGMIYRANNERAEAQEALKKAISSPQDFKEKGDAQAALKDIDHWRHLVP